MNHQSSPRQLNYSHVFLITGLVLSLLVVMFRPAGAEAVLPQSVDVFENSDADVAPTTVKLSDLTPAKNVDYKVILKGQKGSTTVSLTGYPLIEFLKNAGTKTEGVNFVKVRYGTTDDSAISLIPLNQADTERPPIILSSGNRPGLGPFPTPAVVPGQPDFTKAIREDSFVPFSIKGPRLKIVPGKPGAKILSVRITSKKRKNGEFTLTAKPTGAGSGPKSFQWYTYDAKGNAVAGQTGPAMETKDATSGTSSHRISVVVIEKGSGATAGSTGTGVFEYNSKKKAKGATKDPHPDPTGSTGENTGAGTGTGTGTGTGVQSNALGSGTTTTDPNLTQTAPDQTQTTVPTGPTTTPTDATSSSTTSVDSTAITNAAQNVSGTGGLKTVSGVLLSAPTVAPAGSAGGTAISALPPTVANQLNSIFQPVEDVNDAWAYLLALLFAFTFSGAVREWVKP